MSASPTNAVQTCPFCRRTDSHQTATRNAGVNGISILDIGWRCSGCGHEFGFEILKGERVSP